MKKSVLKRLIAGVMIGVGGILPGVSGSALAVAFGLYEQILEAAASLIRNFKSSVRFLLPVALGGAAGLYGVAVLLDRFFAQWQEPMLFFFCGLMLGSLPALLRELKWERGGWKKRYAAAVAAGWALSLLALLTGGPTAADAVVGPAEAALAGALLAAGSLLPGVSTSFLLIRLGWYAPLMRAFTGMDISLLVWCALGAAGAGAALIGVVRLLLRRWPGWVYALTLGLMAGAALSALPRVPLRWESLLYLVTLAAGVLIAELTARAAEKSGQPTANGD